MSYAFSSCLREGMSPIVENSMIVPIAVNIENKPKIEIKIIILGEKWNLLESDSSEALL